MGRISVTGWISLRVNALLVRIYKNNTCNGYYGAFTLPDIETETEIETDKDTNKLPRNQMGIGVGVRLCVVWTPPQNPIQPTFICLWIDLGVGKCEHTISSKWNQVFWP